MLSLGQSTPRQLKMGLQHKVMSKGMGPLYKSGQARYGVSESMGRGRGCFPVMVSYCCYIPEVKDMSRVRHGVAVHAPCIQRLMTMRAF